MTQSAFSEAVTKLRAAGYNVQPADIPGLTLVGHHELTMAQVISFAASGEASGRPIAITIK
jgi:hypothetical protein